MGDKPSPLMRIVAGGLAGASETIITYPAEFCKTRRQLQQQGALRQSSFQILKSTLQAQGVSGVYSGCQALAVSNALKSGVRFWSFETARDNLDKLFGTKNGRRSPWVNVLSGLCAGFTEGIVVVTPGEALKTKIIHDAASGGKRFGDRGLIRSAALVARQEGITGLWSGMTPVLFKQGTNSAVRFTTFSLLKDQVTQTWPTMADNVGTTLLLGALSGVVTVYASMPFDNVKTRMQRADANYRGMFDCAAQLLRTDGVLAFWRGTSPRLVRLTLSSGITFAIYDQAVRFMKSLRPEQSLTRAIP